MSDVSLIVTCVDMLELTKKCVELIKQNTPPIYELIIICDRPSKGMTEWLVSNKEISFHVNPEPVGAPTARNKGIKMAKGKYIGFVDSDVSVTQGWFEPLLQTLVAKPYFGWVASKMMRGKKEMKWSVVSATLFSREAINKVGLFDERFSKGVGWEDNDYLLRFWRAGYFPHGISKSVVNHPPDATTLKMLHGNKVREKFLFNLKLLREKWGAEIDDFIDLNSWTQVPVEE